MASSLYGLYNASRSLMVNQAALSVVNNNITNMNTEGYSKQRLELSQQTVTGLGNNSPFVSAQSGSGALIESISRNRDAYLDAYYQGENTKFSTYKELNSNVTLLQDTVNELNQNGIGKAFSDFYSAITSLSTNPKDPVTRSGVVQRAVDVATAFNQVASRLDSLKTSLIGNGTADSLNSSKINLSLTEFNENLKKIAELNQTISFSTIQGQTPNGLLDERDKILDKLTEYAPLNITKGPNNLVSVSIGNTNLVNGNSVIGTVQAEYNTAVDTKTGTYDPVLLKFVDKNGMKMDITQNVTGGQLFGIVDFVKSDYNNPDKLSISNINNKIDLLASNFAKMVNDIQNGGQYIKTLNPAVLGPGSDYDIFVEKTGTDTADETKITAANIKVNQSVINDPLKLAAAKASATSDSTGDGGNALIMAQSRSQTISVIEGTTVEGYLNSIVGKVGVQTKSLSNSFDTQSSVIDQLNVRRESTNGVNLDEELTDLLKYQRAYEASAKVLSTMDQVLQRILSMAG